MLRCRHRHRVDPAALATEAQIQIQREAAQADIDIKRKKARAEMAIAAFKARQWAEIERIKVAANGRFRARPPVA